jgi:hypothetical protein
MNTPRPTRTRLQLAVPLIAATAWLVAGCGGEVAGTSAAVGKLQADQAKQAKAQQDRIVEQLKAAQEAGAARAASAAP